MSSSSEENAPAEYSGTGDNGGEGSSADGVDGGEYAGHVIVSFVDDVDTDCDDDDDDDDDNDDDDDDKGNTASEQCSEESLASQS